MKITYFKNGNINIKFDNDEIKDINNLENYRTTCIENEVICTLLDSIELDFVLSNDCYGMAGNSNAYYELYNAYTGYEYNPLDMDLIEAASGKTLKLYAHKISDEDLKERYSDYYGD